MKKKGLCVAVLMLCLLLSACQPTPEEEIVTNKGDGVMEEKIFASAVPVTDATELPSHWTETIKISDAIDVAIDCDVRWGDETVYHVEKCKEAEFTPEMVVQIGNAFFGDIVSLREQETSYDELLEALMKIERGYYNGKDENGNIIWAPYDESTKEERSNEIKAQMENTPIESTYVPFVSENIHLRQMDRTTMTVQREERKVGSVFVILVPNNNMINCCVWKDTSAGLWREKYVAINNRYTDYEIELAEPGITVDEAIEKADAFLRSIGIEKAECSYYEKAGWGTISEMYSEGWFLRYAPVLMGTRGMGMYTINSHSLFRVSDVGEYAETYEPECFELYVTENGIEDFVWECPYSFEEVVNENVEILPFEDIQESVRKYFKLAFAWAEDTAGTGTEKLIVKDVVLTSTCTYVKDDLENAYRIPTWAIFYLGDDEERMNLHNSVMLINAIDGTLIYK